MNLHDKSVKILESFLETYTIDGVCGFFVDPEMDNDGSYWVYAILDLDWLGKFPTKPEFVANRIKQGLRKEIMKYTGIDVNVGMSAKKCPDSLSESVSTHIRRRLDIETLKSTIDNLIDYELEPCEHSPVGEFVATVCDMMKDIIIDNVTETSNLTVTPKENDDLYFYLVDTFGKHIAKKYKVRCADGINESKKTYIVTESQYDRLLNEQTYEDSEKDSVKFYKLFKKIVDDKFSELTYNNSPKWSTHEDDVAWSDSDGDIIRYFDYAFLVDRKFFWSMMTYLPISHHATKLMFTKYFKENFPNKPFLSVDEFDV
jgi:translation elongation factor EF-G